MTKTRPLVLIRALLAVASTLLVSCDEASEPTVGEHAAALAPSNLPGCTGRRWVGLSSVPGTCPLGPLDWSSAPVFPGAGASPGLGRYCVYEWIIPPVTPGPPPPWSLAALDAVLAAHGVTAVEEDCVVVGPLATKEDARAWARDEALEQAGATLPLPGGSPLPTRVVVADSSPDAASSIPLGQLEHGYTMGWLAQDLSCPDESLCAGHVSTQLALPRVTNERVDRLGGGFFGTRVELAQAIHAAVETWKNDEAAEQRLVINLSVGWEPDSGCGDPMTPPSLTTTQNTVFAAIAHATCHGALVVAAAGNDPGGGAPLYPPGSPPGSTGPSCPAAWSTTPAFPAGQCKAFEGPAYMAGSSAYPALYTLPPVPPVKPVDVALLYAVGGVDHSDRPITRARQLGSPRLAAIAFQGVAGSRAVPLPQPLTGTSVAAAVTSGIAAAVWAYRPELTAPEVMDIVYRSGRPLSRLADFASPGVDSAVRRASLCDALKVACADSDAHPRCPTAPIDCAAPPPLGGPQNPPLGPDVLAFFGAEFEKAPSHGFTPRDGGSQEIVYRALAAAPWVHPQPDRPPCGACVFAFLDNKLSVRVDESYPSNLELSQMSLILTGPLAGQGEPDRIADVPACVAEHHGLPDSSVRDRAPRLVRARLDRDRDAHVDQHRPAQRPDRGRARADPDPVAILPRPGRQVQRHYLDEGGVATIGLRMQQGRAVDHRRLRPEPEPGRRAMSRPRLVLAAFGAIAGVLVSAARPARAEPELKFLEAGPEGIKIELSSAKLDRVFSVVAMNDDTPGKNAFVPHLLEDASGRSVVPTIEPLKAGCVPTLSQPCSYRILADLPRPETYTTDLDLVYDKKRALGRVTVIWKHAAPGLEVAGSTTVRSTKRWPSVAAELFEWSLTGCCAEHARIDLPLRDTDWTVKKLHPSEVSVTLGRKVAGDRIVQKWAPPPAIERNGAPVKGDVEIAAGATVPLVIDVGGLVEPGVHEVKVRLPLEGRQPLDVTCTVVVREHFLWAVLWIGLGVYGSHRLRKYLGVGRQRLVWLRAVRRLSERLDERLRDPHLTMRERSIGASVRGEIDALESDLSFEPSKEKIETALVVLLAKLTLFDEWLAAAREIAAPELEGERIRLRAMLDGAMAVLDKKGATLDEVDAQRTAIRGAAIPNARRVAVQKDLEDLKDAIEKQKEHADPEAKAALEGKVSAHARDAGLLLEDDPSGARREIVAGRKELAVALAGALTRQLDPRHRPGDYPEEDWNTLCERVRAKLAGIKDAETPADAAMRMIEQAQREYVAALAQHLATEAGKRAAALKHSNVSGLEALNPAVRARGEAFAGMESAAKAAEEGAKKGDVVEAMIAYGAARRDFDAMPTAGGLPGTNVAAAKAHMEWMPGHVPAQEAEALPEPGVASADSITRLVESRDRWVNLTLGFIAVASGLNALWIPNEAWGGADTYLVAILWGFGLHQLGSGPFEGLLGLREKLSKIGG